MVHASPTAQNARERGHPLRRFRRDLEGVAAIEFALVVTLLPLLLLCTLDLGLGFFRKMQVQYAAQAGAEYALLHGFNQDSISNAVVSAANSTAVSATPAPSSFCGCAAATAITTTSCSSKCGTSAAAIYVSVSAQSTYTPFFRYPLLPQSFTLTAQSQVRIK